MNLNIIKLQDELDAYDIHQKELEEKLDDKTAVLIKYQRAYLESNVKSPEKVLMPLDAMSLPYSTSLFGRFES